MNFKISWSLILLIKLFLLFWTDFGETSFCDDFHRNSHKIDLGYQRLRNDDTFEYYLSVDNIFWRMDIIINANEGRSLQLAHSGIDVQFETSHHIHEKRYRIGFCIQTNGQWITGLVDRDSNHIDWFSSGDSIRDQVYIKSTKFDFKDFKPSIGFKQSFESNETNYVYLVEQLYDNRSENYSRKVRYFYIDDSFNSIEETLIVDNENSTSNSTAVEKPIESLAFDQNLIAIISFITGRKSKSNGRTGLILMTQDVDKIKYCFTGTNILSVSCNSQQLKTLIDCSVVKTTTNLITTSTILSSTDSTFSPTIRADPSNKDKPEEQEESSSGTIKTILIIIILIAIPTILLLISILLYIRYQRNNMDTKTTESSESDPDLNVEKVKENKETVKTIFKRENWDSEVDDSVLPDQTKTPTKKSD